MSDLFQILKYVGTLGPNGLAFLNVLVLFWFNARIEALEKESDERHQEGDT